MSSSSEHYDSDSSSSSISIPNISKLQLHDLEPYHQAKLVVPDVLFEGKFFL